MYKNQIKMDQDLSVKHETLKMKEENFGSNLQT